MPQSVRRTLALLALAILTLSVPTVAPLRAADLEEPAVAPDTLDVPALEAQLAEPPAQTPAPSLEDIEGLADPDRDLFFEAIELCDERRHCPSPSCVCLLIRNQVNCFC